MKVFILDVDGVLTTGQFIYSSEGKQFKIFGPDDSDALSLLKKNIEIRFISGDKKGFQITEKRVAVDMGYKLNLVSTIKRFEWIKELYNPLHVIYMGDGIFDHLVMQRVGYSIAPGNADQNAKNHANFITKRFGGDRAVSEACLHILEKFFKPFSMNDLTSHENSTGDWTV